MGVGRQALLIRRRAGLPQRRGDAHAAGELLDVHFPPPLHIEGGEESVTYLPRHRAAAQFRHRRVELVALGGGGGGGVEEDGR